MPHSWKKRIQRIKRDARNAANERKDAIAAIKVEPVEIKSKTRIQLDEVPRSFRLTRADYAKAEREIRADFEEEIGFDPLKNFCYRRYTPAEMAEAREKELGFYLSGNGDYGFRDPVKMAKTFLFQNAFTKAMHMVERMWKPEMQYHIFMKAIEYARESQSLFFNILLAKIDEIVQDVEINSCENALSRDIDSLRACPM